MNQETTAPAVESNPTPSPANASPTPAQATSAPALASQSPTPAQVAPATVKQMKFKDILEHIIAGRKVRRIEWPNAEEYGALLDGYLKIYREGVIHNWLISDGDILAEDWIIIN